MWMKMTHEKQTNQDVVDGDEVSLEIRDYSCTNWFETMIDEVEKFIVESFENCEDLRFFTRKKNQKAWTSQGSSEDVNASVASSAFDFLEQEKKETDHGGLTGYGASSYPSLSSPFVARCVFSIRNQCVQRRTDVELSSEGTRDEVDLVSEGNICVEIHAYDTSHPIARLFCLPLFLLIKNPVRNTYYKASESALYLSILSTAAENVFSKRLRMNLNEGKRSQGVDELSSLFSFHDSCVPCFVPTGDEYQQIFDGFAPPGFGPTEVLAHDTALPHRASQNENPNTSNIAQMLLCPLLVTRFRCNAYGQRLGGCLYLSELVNLFQLHLGPCSRMEMYNFKGMCISISKRFELPVPWRFRYIETNPESSVPSTLMSANGIANEGYTWRELVKRENKGMISVCGSHFLPFGTDVAPIEKIVFDFTWNHLHDYEAQEDANFSLVDPFVVATSPSAEEVNRKCSILAHAVVRCEASLHHSSCDALDILGDKIFDYMQNHPDCTMRPVSTHGVHVDDLGECGEGFQDETMSFASVGSEAQQILIEALAKEDSICSDWNRTNGGSELLYEFLHRHSEIPVGEGMGKGLKPGSLKDLRHAYFPGSLLSRLVHVIMKREYVVEDIFYAWNSCLHELRMRFDSGKKEDILFMLNRIRLPVREPAVDLTESLLVQKIQLLVYCLRAILSEEDECHHQNVSKGHLSAANDYSNEKRDAKMELKKDAPPVSQLHMHINLPRRVSPTTLEMYSNSDGWNSHTASLSDEIELLITNGEPLVRPPALPQPPATFDTISQRAIDLNSLSTRATPQLTSAWLNENELYNDMCLFLYVNEAQNGRVVRFPDFVHWYSPRDFRTPSAPSPDDNDYLSERMQIPRPNPNVSGSDDAQAASRGSNVWWGLWAAAVPRSRERILADAVRPRAKAAEVLRWLEADLPEATLLLDVWAASWSNALHPMLSHRAVIGRRGEPSPAGLPARRGYVRERCDAITAAVGGGLGGAPLSETALEGVRGARARARRGVEEIETALGAALAVAGVLGEGAPPCVGNGLVRALGAPTAEQPREGGLILAPQPVALAWWASWGSWCFQKERERRPREVRVRLTCMAERPLSTSGCFQQLVMEKQGPDEVRLALALSQELL